MEDTNKETFLEKLTWFHKNMWTDRIRKIMSETIEEITNDDNKYIFKKLFGEYCTIREQEGKFKIYSVNASKHFFINYNWFYKKEKKEN